ncbi:MAG: flagellar hook-basal body complex protein [Rhodocyclaceae bacterium]|nr:flagellar hook-basal body complex protein [Rhodocyclaceae bacterium]
MSFTFQQALTGLDAAAQQLDVLGNNIANSGTTAFKRSRVSFGDVYANSVSATNNNPIGLGVSVQAINRIFTQGGLTTTNNPLDVGISGDGFFVVQDVATGTNLYTRAGQFNVDAEGFLTTAGNQRVLGYSPNSGVPRNGPPDVALQVPTGSKDATVTTNINASFNLNAVDKIKTDALNGPFDPTKSDSYNNASSVTVFDQIGSPHTLTMYFRHIDAQKWNVYTLLSDGDNSLKPSVTPAPAPTGSNLSEDTIKPVLDTVFAVPAAAAGGFSAGGTDVILQYRENKSLSDSPLPAAASFVVSDTTGTSYAVNSVAVDPVTNRVTLNTDAIPAGKSLRVSYTPPTIAPLQDKAGNLVTGFTSQSAANLTPDSSTDVVKPVLSSVSVNGNKVVLAYSDTSILDRKSVPPISDFSVTVDGQPLSTPFRTGAGFDPVIDPIKKTLTLTLANPVQPGQSVKLTYAGPAVSGIPIRDLTDGSRTVGGIDYTGPNTAVAFTDQTVSNFTPVSPVALTLDFSGSGVMQNQESAFVDLSFDLTNAVNGTSPTATTPFAFRLNLASINPGAAFATTAFADNFAPNKLDQDGHESGSLAGFSIDNDGNLLARYSNGLTDVKGQIAIANFKTPEKLRAVTGNLYAATQDSGAPQTAAPNSNTSNGRLGVIKPGTLELSNVDLTQELVGLITAQRNYQANAKTIQVQNQAAQAILQAI